MPATIRHATLGAAFPAFRSIDDETLAAARVSGNWKYPSGEKKKKIHTHAYTFMQPSMEERQGSSRSRERDSVTCIIAEHGKKQCRGIAASGREELRINYQAVWLLRAGSSPAGAEEGGGGGGPLRQSRDQDAQVS